MIEQYYCVSTILYIDLDKKKKKRVLDPAKETKRIKIFYFLVGFEKNKSKKVQ